MSAEAPNRFAGPVAGLATAALGAGGVVLALVVLFAHVPPVHVGWLVPLVGLRLAFDPLGAFFLLVTGVVGVVVGVYAVGYLATETAPASFFHLEPWLLAKVLLAAVAFGLASRLFAELSHGLSAALKRVVKYGPLRPALGGLGVIGLFFLAGTPDYLGLGTWSTGAGALLVLKSAGLTISRYSMSGE